MTFGEKLKELREGAGMTQRDLAERVGIDRVSLARLETAGAVPSWPLVYDLAQVLRVSTEVFPSMSRSKGPVPTSRKRAR